jgi:spermidine synthase
MSEVRPLALSPTSIAGGVVLALGFSGFSGLVNQVIWQRALRIYLGGSEALSGMIVVLVFLFGLSLGSALAGRWQSRLTRVLKALALLELSLAVFNLLVALLLQQDLSKSVTWLNSLAEMAHVPLRFAYTVAALALLLPPCLLMGATTPLAGEGIQRTLASREQPTWLTRCVVVNTLGACLGSLAAGLWLLPALGQSRSLLLAALCNALAGGLVLLLSSKTQSLPSLPSDSPRPAGQAGPFSRLQLLALTGLFGALALLYEMWLLRALSLAWLPLPTTFAFCITFYLLAWNAGVALSEKMAGRSWLAVLGAALSLAMAPGWLALDRGQLLPYWARLGYFLPCLFFGLTYGCQMKAVAHRWGRDLGDFLAFNTLGSCLGVVLGQLVGYAYSPWIFASAQALLLAGATLYVAHKERALEGRLAWPALLLAAALYASTYLTFTFSSSRHSYYSIDGVVEIKGNAVFLDGLWHSSFFNPEEVSNDWLMAAAPVLCHAQPGAIRDCLVVGFGLGRTALSLSGLPQAQRIDAYEINQGLRKLLQDYPNETGQVLRDPRVKVFWQDGRSGLALSSSQYDLITSAPLYLKQSGSSALLSKDYFQLLQKHLKPGGIVAVYSRPEIELQGLLVRQTFAEVFPYTQSFNGGYLLIGSLQPIETEPSKLLAKLNQPGQLFSELRGRPIIRLLDQPRLAWRGFRVSLSDDQPLVEFPNWLGHFLLPQKN